MKSNPSSAMPEILRGIFLAVLLALCLVLLSIGVLTAVLYSAYGSGAVSYILEMLLTVLLPIIFFVLLFSIPLLVALIRAYRRGFTPLARSFLEVAGAIILLIGLEMCAGNFSFLLFKGASLEIAMQAVVHGMQMLAEILLLLLPIFVIAPLAARYLDRSERIPYPSFLLISLTVLIFLRNQAAIPLLQSDLPPFRLASLLTLSPIAITAVWMLISSRISLKLLRAERVTDRSFLEFVSELRNRAGMKTPLDVFSARSVEGYARVLGIRRVVLVVSEDLTSCADGYRKVAEPVIMHELMHVKNMDTLSHMLAVTAYRSMLACGALLLLLFTLLPELRDIKLFNLWAQMLFLNPLLLFASERWCCRLREMHADLKVQSMGIDLMSLLRIVSIPRKRRYLFSSATSDRIRFLREPYRAFIPTYLEGFALSIAFIHFLAFSLMYVYSVYPVPSPLFLVSGGMFFAYSILAQMQLRDLFELASKSGLKLGLRAVLTPHTIAGCLAGLLVFAIAGMLPELLAVAFSSV